MVTAFAFSSLVHAQVAAGPTGTVTPALAPNGWGSPSFGSWADNALAALKTGASSYGTPGTPTYYQVAPTTLSVLDNVVTGFPSWNGRADPGSVFGAAFAGELGNRLHFGLDLKGNGTKLAIGLLSFDSLSTDPTNSLGVGFSYAIGDYNYTSQWVGWDYGQDGIRGTADDVFVTSGPNSQSVDEIIGRGSGNAWDIYDSDPGLTRQDKINAVGAKFALGNAPVDFTGTYSYNGKTVAGATVHFTPVPDSGSVLALLGLGLTAVAASIRLRRRFS